MTKEETGTTCKYDAWNRLVKRGNTIVYGGIDALGRRLQVLYTTADGRLTLATTIVHTASSIR